MKRRDNMIAKNVYHPIWDNILYYALIIGLILLVIMVAQRPGKIKLATIILPLLGPMIMGLFLMRIMFGNIPVNVKLQEIESNIEVNGNRVSINNLPDGYWYNITSGTFNSKETQHFEFKYDAFYDQGMLVTKNGDTIELDKDDIKLIQKKAGEN